MASNSEVLPPPPAYRQQEGGMTSPGSAITPGENNLDHENMRLVLLPRGHKDLIVFEHLCSDKAVVPLTLRSHRGFGLAKCHQEEKDYHGYKYFEMGLGVTESAVEAWYDGTFVTLAGSSMVLDVSF